MKYGRGYKPVCEKHQKPNKKPKQFVFAFGGRLKQQKSLRLEKRVRLEALRRRAYLILFKNQFKIPAAVK